MNDRGGDLQLPGRFRNHGSGQRRIIRPISREHDPRMRWAMIGFVSLMCSFGVIAAVLRAVSRSQFSG